MRLVDTGDGRGAGVSNLAIRYTVKRNRELTIQDGLITLLLGQVILVFFLFSIGSTIDGLLQVVKFRYDRFLKKEKWFEGFKRFKIALEICYLFFE